MAKRPVFIPGGGESPFVEKEMVEFAWNPGFAPIQKKKNVTALHSAADKKGLAPLLEISTKSSEELGKRLSAFNLKIDADIGEINLESAFQGSKAFEKGGPYTDIYAKDGRTAKQDVRIRESGELTGFNFFGQEWPLEPKTAFYDWLYVSALNPHREFLRKLLNYRGFTDIEFNPNKSINCQAHACAVFVSLLKFGALDKALRSQKNFIDIIYSDSPKRDYAPAHHHQERLRM